MNNVRHNYAVRFADRDAMEAYAAECERARGAQSTKYAVAPRFQFATPTGRLVRAGDAVTLADFQGNPDQPAWRLLERAVIRGHVLESYSIRGADEA